MAGPLAEARRALEATVARLEALPAGQRRSMRERKDLEEQAAMLREHIVRIEDGTADHRDLAKGADDDDAPPLSDECAACGAVLRRVADAALLACEQCGESQPALSWNWNPQGFDRSTATTAVGGPAYSYKKQNHFTEWLNASQAKETINLPPAVLEKCVAEIRRQGIDPDAVTPTVVRAILKATDQRRYYENVTTIWSRLTGKTPPRFTAAQEEQLKSMFLSIQQPFEEVRRTKFPERRNFLSYSYTLYKLCELRGFDSMLQSYSLLKGRDKLHKQDEIWRGICEILDWQFLPSV